MFEMRLELYQTLEDRGNPDEIEERGPFHCRRSGSWLGEGAYFWDAHIEIAHWWGRKSYNGKYVICQAEGKMDNYCWDLHGNGLHQREFEEVCKEMLAANICKAKNFYNSITVIASAGFSKN